MELCFVYIIKILASECFSVHALCLCMEEEEEVTNFYNIFLRGITPGSQRTQTQRILYRTLLRGSPDWGNI